MSTRQLKSSAGRNRRTREPLTPAQAAKARDFALRVVRGASRIINPDANPPHVVVESSGPRLYSVATITDGGIEYTVSIWATRTRDTLQPDILP